MVPRMEARLVWAAVTWTPVPLCFYPLPTVQEPQPRQVCRRSGPAPCSCCTLFLTCSLPFLRGSLIKPAPNPLGCTSSWWPSLSEVWPSLIAQTVVVSLGGTSRYHLPYLPFVRWRWDGIQAAFLPQGCPRLGLACLGTPCERLRLCCGSRVRK